jgi:hypothetical protein
MSEHGHKPPKEHKKEGGVQMNLMIPLGILGAVGAALFGGGFLQPQFFPERQIDLGQPHPHYEPQYQRPEYHFPSVKEHLRERGWDTDIQRREAADREYPRAPTPDLYYPHPVRTFIPSYAGYDYRRIAPYPRPEYRSQTTAYFISVSKNRGYGIDCRTRTIWKSVNSRPVFQITPGPDGWSPRDERALQTAYLYFTGH